MEMHDSRPPVSELDLRKCEKAFGSAFPRSYLNFLEKDNGGRPHPNVFDYADGSDASMVDFFFCIGGHTWDDLLWNLEVFKGRIMPGFLPIGTDPGGSLILLGTQDPFQGQVFFWDHEAETEFASMDNMHLLDRDLGNFIAGLYELSIDAS
jgi:hypothetical protein